MRLVPPATPAPGLTCRLLPPEEWSKLLVMEPFASRGLPDPQDNWAVLVVERPTPDGPAIVGTCSLYTAMHWDCWWIANMPGAGRGVVLRQLLAAALSMFTQMDIQQVYTGVEAGPAAPGAVDLLTRFGFGQVPGQVFVLRVPEAAAAFERDADAEEG